MCLHYYKSGERGNDYFSLLICTEKRVTVLFYSIKQKLPQTFQLSFVSFVSRALFQKINDKYMWYAIRFKKKAIAW